MGLDIYKCKISSTKQEHGFITCSQEEIDSNKSIKELFQKYKNYINIGTEEYIDIEQSLIKFNLSDEWFLSGYEFNEDEDSYYAVFDCTLPLFDSVKVLYNELITKDEKVYTLYYTEIGYQRRDYKPGIYADLWGCDQEEHDGYYSLNVVTDNSVLELVKMYANENSPLSQWVLNDNDEFIIFDY